MGWAKYMEDDMEIMQNRNANWNSLGFSYPQAQIANHKTSSAISQVSPNCDTLIGVLTEFLDDTLVMSEESFSDKKLVCKSCGNQFSFPASKQRRFAKKGWNPPKHCKRCRELREAVYCMRPSF